MQQFQVNQAMDELQYVRVQMISQLDRASLAERKIINERLAIIDAAVLAAYAAGGDKELSINTSRFDRS